MVKHKEYTMFKKFIKTIQKAQERRVAYWQLQNMSDKALKDIGITRGEIKQKFYGKELV
jgi:uncharacterized protein YjiS (DUF1127 family)|tara:strand:- start:294 stop:470 length:177 start_codon:yes stop_codon:yes gene_type:complete